MTPLETERLIVRNWRADDAALFHRINSDERVMAFFPFRRTRREADDTLVRLHDLIEKNGFGFTPLELRETGECIGFCGINAVAGMPPLPDGTVEIGWRLAPEFWGKGYVTEAAQALLGFAFETLKLDEIVSFAVWNNQRSIAVMERLGMRRDPNGDFDHPRIPDSHPHLKRHVLYRLAAADWRAKNAA